MLERGDAVDAGSQLGDTEPPLAVGRRRGDRVGRGGFGRHEHLDPLEHGADAAAHGARERRRLAGPRVRGEKQQAEERQQDPENPGHRGPLYAQFSPPLGRVQSRMEVCRCQFLQNASP